MSRANTPPKHGPKGAVASFVRPRDNARIWVYPRNEESTDNAVKRVKKHNGAEGVDHQPCN